MRRPRAEISVFSEISVCFLKIILAIGDTLCYDNSAFRMAADSLFVPICRNRVSKGEETARGTN